MEFCIPQMYRYTKKANSIKAHSELWVITYICYVLMYLVWRSKVYMINLTMLLNLLSFNICTPKWENIYHMYTRHIILNVRAKTCLFWIIFLSNYIQQQTNYMTFLSVVKNVLVLDNIFIQLYSTTNKLYDLSIRGKKKRAFFG